MKPGALETRAAWEDVVLSYPTANIFTRVRLGIVNGDLNAKDVSFTFVLENGDRIHIHPSEYGAILDWPDGFCDLEGKLAEAILRGAMRKKLFEEILMTAHQRLEGL